jgi:hypothetical protein
MKRELIYPMKSVIIPAFDNHQGIYKLTVKLYWICPRCEGLRGDVHQVLSYDGSLRMSVDGWINPCGHIDKYIDVRREAKENLLNFPTRINSETPDSRQDNEYKIRAP